MIFSPGAKYYFNQQTSDIVPYIGIRFGKLHYDKKWSKYYTTVLVIDEYGYRYNIPINDPVGRHGTTLVNTPALSIGGGGEYIVNNYGINASCGISYFTKLEDDDDDPENKRTKFFFTLSILYYFNK